MKLLTALVGDPISTIAASWDATMSFAKDALPPTQNRIDRFRELYPRRYAKMKGRIVRQAERWLNSHENGDYEAYAAFITSNEQDRINLIKILTDKD